MASPVDGGAMLLLRSTKRANCVSQQAQIETNETQMSPALPFGERLIAVRKARGLSSAQLGAEVGVSSVTIWKWEKGSYSPRPDKLERLAVALRTTVSLLAGTSDIGELNLSPLFSFGERLALLRKWRRLSLAQLGHRVGVSQVCIWKWERRQSFPAHEKVQCLAHALEVSVTLLTHGHGHGPGHDVAELQGRREEQLALVISKARDIIAEAAGLPAASITIQLGEDARTRRKRPVVANDTETSAAKNTSILSDLSSAPLAC